MGYPLMLCIVQCECGATEQQWVDVSEKVLEDPQYTKIVWRKIGIEYASEGVFWEEGQRKLYTLAMTILGAVTARRPRL